MKNNKAIAHLSLFVAFFAGSLNSALATTVLVCTNPTAVISGTAQPELPGYVDLKMGTLDIEGNSVRAKFYLRDVASPAPVDMFSNPSSDGRNYVEYQYGVKVDTDGQVSTGCSNGMDYQLAAFHVPRTAAPRTLPLASILDAYGYYGPYTQYSDGCRSVSSTGASLSVDSQNGVLTISGNVPGASAQTRYSLYATHFDGTASQTVTCEFGTPGASIQLGQDQFQVPNGIVPPDAVKVTTSGTLEKLSLEVDLKIDDLLLKPAAASAFSASGYNVYVVANVPGMQLFQKAKIGTWGSLTSPLSAFLENQQVSSADQRVRVEILRDLNVTQFRGAEIYLGYGTSDAEMLQNRRYRGIYKIPASGTAP